MNIFTQRLLLALDGTQIYPKPAQSTSKADSFEAVTTAHQQEQRFSFYKKGIEKSATIYFIKDPTTAAVVSGPREVSYSGKTWCLPLPQSLYIRCPLASTGKRSPRPISWRFFI